jgi:NADH dehydrogenase [ubiquinone] 1 alpha subcomplex assembly factor 7
VAAPLANRVRDRIRRDGPLSFRQWMDACLYDPDGGFYAQGRHPAGVGTGTHFATSPTLHPFFAQCVARELAASWKAAGRPAAWEVVEFGAGTGALARDAMQELRRLGVPARWSAIDVKPGQPFKGGRWLDAPPATYDAAVANEFLDALPFDILEWSAGEGAWQETGVDVEGDGFGWVLLGSAEPPLPPPPTPGSENTAGVARRISMPANDGWLAGLAKARVKVAVVIDYGAAHPATDARAFHGHEFADPLAEPGSVDITADVDFAELAQQAKAHGFSTDLESQEAFLIRHGAFDAINKIDRTSLEGGSAYLRFRQLLLPTGFGAAFKVARLTRQA